MEKTSMDDPMKLFEIGNIKRIAPEEIEWRFNDEYQYNNPYRGYKSPTFYAADVPWSLSFYWSGIGGFALTLKTKMPRKYSVQYNFASKINGNLQQIGSGIMREDEFQSKSWPWFFNSIPPNIFRCTVRHEITHSTQPTELDETQRLKLIDMNRLSEKLKELFNMKETCDTTLKVMDKEYKAHRNILISQSPVFAAMFAHDTAERQTGVINIPDCDPDSFQEFLEYLYCGKLEDVSLHSALHLYVTSDKYEVLELKTFCVEFLKSCLAVENVCEIAAFADKYDEADLFSAAQNCFNENVCKIFDTCEWEFLMETNFRLANKLLKEMAKIKLKS